MAVVATFWRAELPPRPDAGLGAALWPVRATPEAAEPARAPVAPLARIFYRPDVSSRISVSSSFKLLFHTFTMASAPDEVKKSPPGEKLQVVDEPSWP